MKDESYPAFPGPKINNGEGFTKKEYAALWLRVPESGVKWLDEMIEKSLEQRAP